MGFINWRRIFQIEVSPLAAPFMPRSCRALAELTELAEFSGDGETGVISF